MRRAKTKEEFWNMRLDIIKRHGGSCEVRGDYAVCTAPWWPFRWILELIEAWPGDYGLHAVFCFDNSDPRCQE